MIMTKITFPSSPRALASFASSFRRSSVTGGMFNRITLARERHGITGSDWGGLVIACATQEYNDFDH